MSPDNSLPLEVAQTMLPRFFAPAPGIVQLLRAQPDQFFIMRIEEMYPHLRGPVPATRAAGHSGVFVTTGVARMAVGYEQYIARPGELLLVPAGQVHSYEPHDVNTGYLLHFHPELLLRAGAPAPEFLTSWGHPLLRFEPAAAAFVQVLLGRMLALYQPDKPAALPRLLPHLATLLAEATLAYRPQPGPAPSAAVALTQRFKTLLSQRIRHTHGVAAYAELLHITPNHLNKAVKTASGKSPTRWIDEALVLEAKSLLFQTTLPVAEVAALVGVADASYFSRLFKKLEGRSPSALRQTLSPG